MGHARTYLTMDIIRRVLEDYFRYDVLFVQNVTDIDDKIILRARQEYLFKELKKQVTELSPALIADAEQAWSEYAQSKLKHLDPALVRLAASDWTEFTKKMTPEEIEKAILVDPKYKMTFTALVRTYMKKSERERDLLFFFLVIG